MVHLTRAAFALKRRKHVFVFPVGIGMDSCVIPLRHGGLSLVQTTDFFYPLVEDPYMMVGFCCWFLLTKLQKLLKTSSNFSIKASKTGSYLW